LDNKVPGLEDVVLEQDFKSIQDGVASIVQAKVTGDGVIGEIATERIQAVTGIDVRIRCDGIRGEETDKWRWVLY
jgi:hypothetical protein